jgi:hypothetical protein
MKWLLTLVCINTFACFAVTQPNLLKTDINKLEKSIRDLSTNYSPTQKLYLRWFRLSHIFSILNAPVDSVPPIDTNVVISITRNNPDIVLVKYFGDFRYDFLFTVYNSSCAIGVVSRYFENTKIDVNGIFYINGETMNFIKTSDDKVKVIYILHPFLFPRYKLTLAKKNNQLVFITYYLLKSDITDINKREWTEAHFIPTKKVRFKNINEFVYPFFHNYIGFSLTGQTTNSIGPVLPWMRD